MKLVLLPHVLLVLLLPSLHPLPISLLVLLPKFIISFIRILVIASVRPLSVVLLLLRPPLVEWVLSLVSLIVSIGVLVGATLIIIVTIIAISLGAVSPIGLILLLGPGIRKYRIGLINFLKLGLLPFIMIWMVFHRQLIVGGFNLCIIRCFLYSQYLIIILIDIVSCRKAVPENTSQYASIQFFYHRFIIIMLNRKLLQQSVFFYFWVFLWAGWPMLLLISKQYKMSQQSEEEENKLNEYIKKNPIGEQTAEKLHRKMLKNICRFFGPFKQYFESYPVEYLLIPKPTYIQQQPLQNKYKLALDRQIEYFRGSVSKQHIDEEYMQSLLSEQMKDRGLVENHRNKSLFVGSLFLYASGSRLESVRVVSENSNSMNTNTNSITTSPPTNKNNNEEDIKIVSHKFNQPIFQIAPFQDSVIIVRSRYWIHLFDVISGKILTQTRLKQEITSISLIQGTQIVLISTYDQKNYRLYQWKTTDKEITCVRICQSFYPVHSLVNLNRRQFVVGQANQVFIEDLRCQGRQTLKRISQIGNDRYCCVAQMAESKNQIVASRAKFLDIFDLRNPNPSLYNVRHFCEEAPPSCLLTFNLVIPVVVAYSPYPNGSSLLFNINPSQISKTTHQIYSQQNDPPMLLFDSGKIYKGLYPKSISPKVEQNTVRLFHVDSSDGICLEVLKRQKQLGVVRLSPENGRIYPQQPCKRWILQKQLAPYLDGKKVQSSSSSDSQSDQSQFRSEESQIFLKKNNYCSLDKFRMKIGELAKTNKQPPALNQAEMRDTLVSTFSESLHDHKIDEILKNKIKKSSHQHKISQEMLDFLMADWKL